MAFPGGAEYAHACASSVKLLSSAPDQWATRRPANAGSPDVRSDRRRAHRPEVVRTPCTLRRRPCIRFYTDLLGFTKKWHADNGQGTVCQVDRGDCEIILCEAVERRDKGRLFIELNRDGMDELRREILERTVPSQLTWWGYDAIQIVDPDGNEHLFPLDETNDRERQS
jgi:hypothetical protein